MKCSCGGELRIVAYDSRKRRYTLVCDKCRARITKEESEAKDR